MLEIVCRTRLAPYTKKLYCCSRSWNWHADVEFLNYGNSSLIYASAPTVEHSASYARSALYQHVPAFGDPHYFAVGTWYSQVTDVTLLDQAIFTMPVSIRVSVWSIKAFEQSQLWSWCFVTLLNWADSPLLVLRQIVQSSSHLVTCYAGDDNSLYWVFQDWQNHTQRRSSVQPQSWLPVQQQATFPYRLTWDLKNLRPSPMRRGSFQSKQLFLPINLVRSMMTGWYWFLNLLRLAFHAKNVNPQSISWYGFLAISIPFTDEALWVLKYASFAFIIEKPLTLYKLCSKFHWAWLKGEINTRFLLAGHCCSLSWAVQGCPEKQAKHNCDHVSTL